MEFGDMYLNSLELSTCPLNSFLNSELWLVSPELYDRVCFTELERN